MWSYLITDTIISCPRHGCVTSDKERVVHDTSHEYNRGRSPSPFLQAKIICLIASLHAASVSSVLHTMANHEAYMLQRNAEESSRLDTQHTFLRALAHGELIHSSIPREPLRAVADVGAGTGVWLKETAQELENTQDRLGGVEYVGFDISPSQFPHDKAPGIDFVVHDVNEPFPHRYHAKFDLVHVRFLSYAISAPGMLRVVENVVQILSQY